MNSSERLDLVESKINKIEETLSEIKIKKEAMSVKCNGLEAVVSECCSKKNFEEKIIAHSDLKNLISEFKKFNENGEKRDEILNKRLESYESRLVVHERYFLIGVGIILTLETLGIGDIIRREVLGG